MEYFYLGLEAQLRENNKFPDLMSATKAAIHAATKLGYSVRVFLMDEFRNSIVVEKVNPGLVDQDFDRYKGL
jgi:hypothetical protein